MTKRVFITGTTGLVGRWTADLMHRQGWTVLGIDRKPAPAEREDWAAEELDLLDREALGRSLNAFGPTVVIHLAARTDLDGKTLEDYRDNTTAVDNLCAAISECDSVTRGIYTSSQLVCRVGMVPTGPEEYEPSTVYGESKIETEKRVRAAQGGGVTWCLTRPTTVWGPHMSAHYRSLYRHIQKRTYFHAGGGDLWKSYSYAENIATQYMRLAEAPAEAIQGKVFYLADYEALSLKAYANRIADELGVRRPVTLPYPVSKALALVGDGFGLLGISAPFNSFRLKNIRTEYIFDMSETEAVCGPLPVGFEEGVKRTVAWHQASAG